MKPVVHAFLAVALLLAGCGKTSTDAARDTDVSSDTDAVVETDGQDTDAASDTDGPGTCDIWGPDACSDCMETSCCEASTACVGDDHCITCLSSSGTEPECQEATTAGLVRAFRDCRTASCNVACSPPTTCNPITNAGCNANETCDIGPGGVGFNCFPDPGSVGLCGACENASGLWCQAGLICVGGYGTCSRYCCNDSDCGAGGTCKTDDPLIPGDAGYCVQTANPSASACGAPATAPSGGSCVSVP